VASAHDDRVVVVWAPVPSDVTSLVDLLDRVEHARLNELRVEAERRRYVAAHALLRLVVAEMTDRSAYDLAFVATCPACGGPHGKPALAATGEEGLHVNLSHAGDRVVVAVTRAGPVGIDVERHDATLFEGFDDIALSTAERAGIARLPPRSLAAARAQSWVRKEAILKATGQGLTVPLSDVEVSAPDEPARLLAWRDSPVPVAAVHVDDIEVGDAHSAAVALIGDSTVLRVVTSNGGDMLHRHELSRSAWAGPRVRR